jgi:N-acetylglutamate synthase-like GNAT family acetyltransferase
MTPDDFKFAVRITDAMNWKMTQEDFEFMLKLDPQGCFVLLDDSQKIGIATTISFGKIGWFGNLIVTESHRNKGAGSQLVKHAIKYLTSKKVETIGLYAYLDKIPFYRKLGFEYESEFTVLKGKGFSSPAKVNLRQVKKENIQDIVSLDKACFGASRKKILEPILLDPNNPSHMAVEDGQILGYATAKPYEDTAELGPLVCKQGCSDIAINLLKANLNKLIRLDVYTCVGKRESAVLKMLMQSGFKEDFRVARMFFKPQMIKDCIYVAESLERG